MNPKFLFSIFFVLIVPYAYAQDTIYKRNNETVIAKVLEINQAEVKYKKYSYPDGPLYINNKSEIKRIRFANGQTEEFKAEPAPPVILNYFTPPPASPRIEAWGSMYHYKGVLISERDAQFIMEETNDPKIISYMQQAKKAKMMQYIGFGAIPLGLAATFVYYKSSEMVYNPNTYNYQVNPNRNSYLTVATALGVVAVACPVEAIISKIRRNTYNAQAVRLYNQKF